MRFENFKNRFIKTKETLSPRPSLKQGVDFVFKKAPRINKIGTKEQYTKYILSIFPNSKIQTILYHGSPLGKKKVPLLNYKYGKEIVDFSEEGRKKYIKEVKRRGSRQNAGFYFSPSPNREFLNDHPVLSEFKHEGAGNYGRHIYPVVVNFKNLADSDLAMDLSPEDIIRLAELGYDSVALTAKNITKYHQADEMKLAHEREVENDEIIEYVAFRPEQVFILGSEKDLQNFQYFMKHESPP